VSNKHYPASSFNSIEVFDALATTVDSKVLGPMQFFYNHFFKDCFYLKELYPPVFTG
jgi:hypothetical protein